MRRQANNAILTDILRNVGFSVPKDLTYNRAGIISERKLLFLFKKHGVILSRTHHRALLRYSQELSKEKTPAEINELGFVFEALTSFTGESLATVKALLKAHRKESLESYKEALPRKRHARQIAGSSGLVSFLGRHEKRKFAVMPRKKVPGYGISRSSKAVLKDLSDEEIRFSQELVPASPCTAMPGVEFVGPKQTPYRPTLSTSKFTLFVQASPAAKHPEIEFDVDFDEDFSREFFGSKDKVSHFSFIVTAAGILERDGSKRPISQKAAMGGLSASDIFKALGVKIKDSDKRKHHLAHRHGWGLGGLQDQENLDPATDGSNYTTLFYIESVIRDLILKRRVEAIIVTGTIQYHAVHTGVPEKITYHCEWGKGNFIEKSIYPLRYRRPTLSEHHMAKAVATLEHLTPPESAAEMAASGVPAYLSPLQAAGRPPPTVIGADPINPDAISKRLF